MNAVAPLFVDADELRTLTGRAGPRQQIDALKAMGVPFYINAAGRPVVVRSKIEGKAVKEDRLATWTPSARTRG